MMSNICLKSEKSKCSIGCFVGSTVKVVNKQVFNKQLLRKELFLMNTILNHDITEGQQITGTWKSEMAVSSKESKKSSSELIKRQPWTCSVYFGYIVISNNSTLKEFFSIHIFKWMFYSACILSHLFKVLNQHDKFFLEEIFLINCLDSWAQVIVFSEAILCHISPEFNSPVDGPELNHSASSGLTSPS